MPKKPLSTLWWTEAFILCDPLYSKPSRVENKSGRAHLQRCDKVILNVGRARQRFEATRKVSQHPRV